MTVTIPSCEQHEGIFLMTVTISDYCPKCGKKRGVDTIHKGFSYDGSRRLVVDCWENPCGHVDKYSEVREEVKRNNLEKQVAEAKQCISEYVRINSLPPVERGVNEERALFNRASEFLKKYS